MNLIAAAISIATLFSAVAAEISFKLPTGGTFWYTKVPNYLNIMSTNVEEKFATVRFSGCNECFSLSVMTNTTVPIVLPRYFRRSNYINLYAISNFRNTAWTTVNVIDTLCVTGGQSCYDKLPCDRRRGCGYYAENSANAQQEVCQAELAYVEYGSAEADAMRAEQEQAAADLTQDIQALVVSTAVQSKPVEV